MDDMFSPNERLYRAVLPRYKKKNGRITTAAFRDNKGLSVERGNQRPDGDVVDDMRRMGFRGDVIYVQVIECRKTEAKVLYRPTARSKYHSEIHGKDSVVLSDVQCKYLADHLVIVE